jgi:aminoglycoside 3-N-acetyltransferase
MADYSRADLKAALDRLPLERGTVVFCHANLGYFGRAGGIATSGDLCEMFFESVMERVGGGLCVPTFTYSFQNGEVFDRQSSASKMGVFAEWVRKLVGAYRSFDPCYSVSGVHAGFVNGPVAENSFDGMTSFFAKFTRAGGQVLNFNFDAGSTFVHWVERELRVPYRFDKTFDGVIRDRGQDRPMRNTIWVRYLDDALEARFEVFDAIAREQGKFVTTKLGRGEMGVISAGDTYNLIAETLPKRPWFLTKAEAMGVEPDPAKFSALR